VHTSRIFCVNGKFHNIVIRTASLAVCAFPSEIMAEYNVLMFLFNLPVWCRNRS
jgi:hypothetical protein